MDLNDGPCSAQLWLQRHSQARLQGMAEVELIQDPCLPTHSEG